MKQIFVRSASGFAYVLLLVTAICLKSPGIYVAAFAFLAATGVREYTTLVQLNQTRWLRTILDCIAAAYLFVAVLLYATGGGIVVFSPYVFYIIYTAVRNIYSERENMILDTAQTFFGQIYVALPLSLCSLIAFPDFTFSFADMRSGLLLVIFVLIWINDTAAFFTGITIGRHKLFPSVSPKKTWEGFLGGLLFSILSSIVIGRYLFTDMALPYVFWAVLGAITSLSGTWGDLFESNIKRIAGVKDSGTLIPGHGGVLDRIDSLLFALPVVYVYYAIFL